MNFLISLFCLSTLSLIKNAMASDICDSAGNCVSPTEVGSLETYPRCNKHTYEFPCRNWDNRIFELYSTNSSNEESWWKMAWSPTISTSGAESNWQDLVSHCSDSSSGIGGIKCVSVGVSTILSSAIQYGLYINGSSSNFEYSDGSVNLDVGSASSGTKTFHNVSLSYQNVNLFSLDFDHDDSTVEIKASIHPDSYN
ncbi:unnamed protein product [Ambrosiozyma monospora]|uniref:Unnamed protein product n=1 Tax=Ambrosiozyma monospora TaxID=43982 RepID=A0A9W6Z5L3_AMBMO|nr:unnamed protein product [Ambrosiozyma monospora]